MSKTEKSGSFYRNNERVVPPNFKVISEGCADIIFENEKEVFYNNVQVINRDLSCLVIQQFVKEATFHKINILEALGATGLRSIRYWKEIEGLNSIICNDLEEAAHESIRRNVLHNEISVNHVIPSLADCNHLMYDAFRNGKPFEVIDLDPYGSAIPFLATSLKAIRNGGLLCVTCTDLPVLCGSQKGTAFGKYGIYPVKKKHCHELALRMLITSIQRMASVEKKVVEPVLSLYIDFYVRIFLRVKTSAKDVRAIHKRHGYLYHCTQCPNHRFVPIDTSGRFNAPHNLPLPVCEECDSRFTLCGPVYTGPLHNPPFLDNALTLLEERGKNRFSTFDRVKGMVTIARNELPTSPLFYHLPTVCANLRCSCPKAVLIKSALLNLGYDVSRTHCNSDGFKTNASSKVVMDIFRSFVKEEMKRGQYSKLENKPELAQRIMAKEIVTNGIDFSIHPSLRDEAMSRKKGRKKKVKAFFPNPERYWGPKSRAHGNKMKKKKKEEEKKKVEEEEEVEEVEERVLVGKKRKRGEDDDGGDIQVEGEEKREEEEVVVEDYILHVFKLRK